MELYQLKFFLSVAQYENVSKAAQAMHASQPSVSRAIHTLEEELGVMLLKRTGRNVALTYEGQLFQKRLEPVISELETLERDMKEKERRERETIRLSMLSGSPLITKIIGEFKKENPNVSFWVYERFEMTQWDLCVRSALPDTSYNSAVKLLDERIYLAVNKKSRLAEKKTITLDELRGEPFISLREGTNMRAMSEKYFHEVGFVPNVVYESDTLHILRYMLREGLGVAIWPELSWGDKACLDYYNVCLKDIEMPPMHRSIYLIRHKDQKLSEAAERFADFLVEKFADFHSSFE